MLLVLSMLVLLALMSWIIARLCQVRRGRVDVRRMRTDIEALKLEVGRMFLRAFSNLVDVVTDTEEE